MPSLMDYQKVIHTMAIIKGWNTDLSWMELGIFKETGELVNAIEHEQSIEEIGNEFGDIMFFLLQTMQHFNIDLDEALNRVIERNRVSKKKTLENGVIVRK